MGFGFYVRKIEYIRRSKLEEEIRKCIKETFRERKREWDPVTTVCNSSAQLI